MDVTFKGLAVVYNTGFGFHSTTFNFLQNIRNAASPFPPDLNCINGVHLRYTIFN